MRPRLALAFACCCMLPAASAPARPMGLIRPAGLAATPPSTAIRVLYHGGPVMRSVTLHTVFWAPPPHRFSGSPSAGAPGYEQAVKGFLAAVAADSGSATSVFSVLPEFSDTSGAGAYAIGYDPGADAVDDVHPYPAGGHGCASPAGIAACVTDAGLRHELASVIARAAPAAAGLHDLWIVFLPPDVDECISAGSCATNAFAGYHSLFLIGGRPVVYAPVPDPLVEMTPPPGSDPQGSPEAESAIDTAAHETVEAITDPTGVGWMDPNGAEVGDKCETGPQYGAPLGFAANGAPYNQVIAGERYLLQMMWSNAAGGCVQRAAPGPAPAGLLPHVYMTQFSPLLSGWVGRRRGGVAVRALLSRAGGPVAVAEAVTRADGSWGPAMLRGLSDGAPRGVGDDRDALTIAYGRGGPPREAILTGNGGNPFTQAGFTGWYDLDTGLRIGRGAIDVAPCSQTGVLELRVGGALQPSPTLTCGPDTNVSVIAVARLTRRTPIVLASDDNRAAFPTDPAGALVRLTIRPGEPGSFGALDNQLVPFEPSGIPACTADLQFQRVACGGLVPGALYTVARRGARVRAWAGGDGVLHAARLRVREGDLVVLRGAGGRVLTVLHVARLRVDVAGARTVASGGTCDPGEYVGPPLSEPPTSSAAITSGVVGSGRLCPLSGDAAGLPLARLEQLDDRSGGTTRTEVPLITDTSPAPDETVYGGFVVLAGAGFDAPDGSLVRTAAAVSVTVMPAAGGRPVLRARNVNTPGGVRSGPLPPGVYRARWRLTDANGDTRTVLTRFIASPAA